MAFNHIVSKAVSTPEGAVTSTKTYTGTSVTAVDESVVSPSTNLLVNVAIDVSEIESIYMLSDQNMTVKTNSSSAPDNTINLLAGVPYEWQSDSYFTNLLTVDVTKVYLTQSSGSTATFQIRCVQDSTP